MRVENRDFTRDAVNADVKKGPENKAKNRYYGQFEYYGLTPPFLLNYIRLRRTLIIYSDSAPAL